MLSETPQQRAARLPPRLQVRLVLQGRRKISTDIASLDWSVSDGDAESEDPNETSSSGPTSTSRSTRSPRSSSSSACWSGRTPPDRQAALPEDPDPQGLRRGRLLVPRERRRARPADRHLRHQPERMSPRPAPRRAAHRLGPRQGPPLGRGAVRHRRDPRLLDRHRRRRRRLRGRGGRGGLRRAAADRPHGPPHGRPADDRRPAGGDDLAQGPGAHRGRVQDALRAWRNVASDPNAGPRLLLFPEPMEYAAGASTPAEIGIPELAALNRDNILTAFPISPYQLGVPMPGGLNSGESASEDRRDYWGDRSTRGSTISRRSSRSTSCPLRAGHGPDVRLRDRGAQPRRRPSLIEKVAAYKGARRGRLRRQGSP
jgi:hypothetical protein